MSAPLLQFTVGGVPEHFNLPWHLAIEDQAFEALDLKVKFQDVGGGTGAMMKGLASGKFDMVIALTEGCVSAIMNGVEAKIVKVYVESPLIWGIHVPANSQVQRIEEIQNLRYAISRLGSGSHLMAIVDAAERGWSTDLEFEIVGNLEGARVALHEGHADNFLWERFTTSPFVDSGEFRRVGERRTLWPAFVICVRNELLSQHQTELTEILKVINCYAKQLMENSAACQMISERYKIKLADVEQWFEQTDWNTNFEEPARGLRVAKDYLKKIDLVTQQQLESVNR